MLAIIARCGQFLSACLTFGPINGPEDFAYVVDRNFAPGKDAKRRYCTEWQAYVDDPTVRTGKVLDGHFYTADEITERLREAEKLRETRKLQEAQRSYAETTIFVASGRCLALKPLYL